MLGNYKNRLLIRKLNYLFLYLKTNSEKLQGKQSCYKGDKEDDFKYSNVTGYPWKNIISFSIPQSNNEKKKKKT